MRDYSRRAIAARIQSLLGNCCVLSAAADRVGVTEHALRVAVDPVAPTQTTQLLAAIVRVYGVDPNWLVTGVYDSCTHKCAVSDTAMERTDQLEHLIADIVAAPFRWPLPPMSRETDRTKDLEL